MGTVYALLVGVSRYTLPGCVQLPMCVNDLSAMRNALIQGLQVKNENIVVCGKDGVVTEESLSNAFRAALEQAGEEDTFLFYFSGHGGTGCLALSAELIDLQSLIDALERVPAKNKIIILDSCHSGGFSVHADVPPDVAENIEQFVGHGYAVMASCGADQVSGFDQERQISQYTRFVCDAFTARSIMRQGKKSLESINTFIRRLAEVSNASGAYGRIQTPIFRANVGGTIFFEVEAYQPYEGQTVYAEYDDYIIYAVEPVHTASQKRLSVKVLLRYPSAWEEIARIEKDIVEKLLYCDVYASAASEERFKGKAVNIMWCYFGYDEDDITRGNFVCCTTWVDENQDRDWWYRENGTSRTIDHVYFAQFNDLYRSIKQMRDGNLNEEDLIRATRACTSELVQSAEDSITLFREYQNGVLEESEMFEQMEPLVRKIQGLYLTQSDFPIPPTRLAEWSEAHIRLASIIHDFSLFYNRENRSTWNVEQRENLMIRSIQLYQLELEALKEIAHKESGK